MATRHLAAVRALMPGAIVVFDAFELGFVREGRRNRFEGQGAERCLAMALKVRELSLAQCAEVTWASSQADAGWIAAAAPGLTVDVVPPVCDAIEGGPGFHDRAGVVVVSDPAEPSRRDAESFFVREILPRVHDRCPGLVYDALRFDAHPGRAGAAPDLGRQLDRARVLVAPFRFSSGIPFELVHALARGVPVVTTSAGAEGLDLGSGDAVVVADSPAQLSAHVAAVVTDPGRWERLVESGRQLIADRFSSEAARRRLEPTVVRLLSHGRVPDRTRPVGEEPIDLGPLATAPRERAAPDSEGHPPSPSAGPGRDMGPMPPRSPERPGSRFPLEPLRASAIVCTHNGSALIEGTLQSLLNQDFPAEDVEIVVVDNASTDRTPELLRTIAARHPGRIRVVQEPVLGLSSARNRGILESCGRVIAFTDDDARVRPRWLRALVDACERPEVAGAGGPVRAALEDPLPAWVTPALLPYLALFDQGTAERDLVYNEYPRGVNMALPRRSFQEVGLFSTAFGRKGPSLLSCEETDLCYRLERLGRRILYVPGAEVDHVIHAGRLTPDWFKLRFYWQGKSEAYFDLVHRGPRFVAQRLQDHRAFARAERARSREAGNPADPRLHGRTWTFHGYRAGAVQGWITGAARRARAPRYEGSTRRAPYRPPSPAAVATRGETKPEASIVIPSKNGGHLFALALECLFAQRTPWPFEVVVVDSGSNAESLSILRRFPVRLHAIAPADFNHGRTRDLGASLARGDYLVFINQDAVPCSEDWLARLLEPLRTSSAYAAVQGGIREFPDHARFFWESCGPRFYFTRESERWIPRYGGIGFSTVNAAIRRTAWEICPFGEAVMMEDKQWQRAACARGLSIAHQPEAAVYHTHNYDLPGLIRRCQQEGFGWRLVGETYSLPDMLRDTISSAKYRELWRGLREGRVRTAAELLFPVLRPWLVFRGNRLCRSYPG